MIKLVTDKENALKYNQNKLNEGFNKSNEREKKLRKEIEYLVKLLEKSEKKQA